MAAPTKTTTTNYAVGSTGNIKEDVSQVIANISPVDTPFFSAIGRENCNNTTPNWLYDEITDAASNAATEGAEASFSESSAATRIGNVTQILQTTVSISGTLEATALHGRKSEVKYQLAKGMKQIARDTEFAMHNASYTTGATRKMRSTFGSLTDGWVTDSSYYGSSCYYAYSGYASTNLLTEDKFNDMIQNAWAEGGDVDMVLASPAVKRTISNFNASNKVTVNANQADKRVVATVDYYEGDFGTVKIVPERFYDDDTSSGSYYDRCLFIQKDLWKTLYLRPFKTAPIAKTGDAHKFQILGELSLKCTAPKGNAAIAKIARS